MLRYGHPTKEEFCAVVFPEETALGDIIAELMSGKCWGTVFTTHYLTKTREITTKEALKLVKEWRDRNPDWGLAHQDKE